MLWHTEQGLRNDQPLHGLVPGVLAFLFEQKDDLRLDIVPFEYQLDLGLRVFKTVSRLIPCVKDMSLYLSMSLSCSSLTSSQYGGYLSSPVCTDFQ